jgi:2-desacetyl-2-hydroxyethyl bacteriochlorophyllide A dehydrogenase
VLLKRVLNAVANRVLRQLGYSEGRAQEAKREAWWWLQARSRMVSGHRRLLAGSAVVWTGPGRAQLVEVEVPSPGPGQVTIEVVASVVSPGTERAQYLRLPNTSIDYPHIPGYSAAGLVVAAGRGVSTPRPGDLVAGRTIRHVSLATVDAGDVCIVPPGVTPEAAATLQLGTISAQGVRRAAIEPGEPVCVIGAGLIGLLAQRLAIAGGCGPTTIVAASRAKEAFARASADAQFLVWGDDREEIEALGAPVVIDATGDPAALGLALAAAGPSARVILLGSSRGETRDVPVAAIRAKGLRLIGAHVETLAAESRRAGQDLYRREAEYLRALADRRLSVEDLIDWPIDPREAATLYRDLVERGGVIGARFDWTLLAASARRRPARAWRLPDLSARGIEYDEKPVPIPMRGVQQPRAGGDPFAGATGRLRIGLLGCGEIGLKNADAIAQTPNAQLVACFDPSQALAEELARANGARVCESTDALVDMREVDAVLVAVPHHLHAALAIQAANAGKHVIVEKPAANTLAGAAEIASAAEDAQVVLSFCFPHRYQPHIQEAKRLVGSGALGEFTGMLIKILSKKPEGYWYGGFSGRAASDWRASKEKAGGGFLIMNVCHYFDMVRYLIGVEAELISAYLEEPQGGRDVENAVSVAVRYENAAIGTIVGSAGLAGFESARNEIHVWGRDGHLTLEPSLRVHTLRALDGLRAGKWHTVGGLGARSEIDIRAIYFSRLATAIATGERPDVTAADGLAIQAFLEAAYRADDERQGVRPADLLAEVTQKAPA